MKLRILADAMDEVAVDLDYYGGFAGWSEHGRQMAGAGNIARQWADEIVKQKATPDEIKRQEEERKERNMKWLKEQMEQK